MFHFSTLFGGYRSTCALLLALALVPCPGFAGNSEKVLYLFRGGNDGAGPGAGLTLDGSGKLYGTTLGGGDPDCAEGRGQGCGVIFRVKEHGEESVLYAFVGGDNDGAFPDGGLIADGAGNYYGVAGGGGPNDAGTVYKLTPDGTESIVYAFKGGSDGRGPIGDLAMDKSGDLYGTANQGGDFACDVVSGCGTVFEITPGGVLTVLHAFHGGNDGEGPPSGLIADSSGDLYGTTGVGGNGVGCGSLGCGTVFKIASDGTETILHAFQADGSDGTFPWSGLILDGAGNLYGTTANGGTCSYTGGGCGTVFEIAPDGTETVLYSFRSGNDGDFPEAGVVIDSTGNLYGTTFAGGGVGCKRSQGCGTAFKLAPNGTETVLYAFDPHHGARPVAPLLLVGTKLYGTTNSGGSFHNGVVFDLRK
ncbi:MAG TPA: choice-of-anchor tandem repeat GloVer-containing protein [Rhizomicrobium sp.]|jgi:uncharacterized repeat protein (TIGR03803 family)